MRRLSGYPRWFFAVLMGSFALLLASGLLLVPTMLDLRLDWQLNWQLAAELRSFSALTHSAGGFIAMLLLGALAAIHMRMGWRKRQQLVSGFALLSLFALMWLSALGIYYFGDENWSLYASLAHLLAAIAATALFVWHYLRGRPQRQARATAISPAN